MNNNTEQLGISYSKVGDYNLPNLILPTEKEDFSFGKYGRMRLRYLKEHRRVQFVNLLTSGKLNEHLSEINERANAIVEQFVQGMAKRNGTDETLKATDQMKWVGRMNNYRASAEEFVICDCICK